jgi:hypothetical protein
MGDVARMNDDGYLLIADRLKDQINTAGFKVWPREVEEADLSLGLKATSTTRLMPAGHLRPWPAAWPRRFRVRPGNWSGRRSQSRNRCRR